MLVPGRGSGAVVVSGASEAGGGSELSPSDAGKGASLFGAPGLAGALPAVLLPGVRGTDRKRGVPSARRGAARR